MATGMHGACTVSQKSKFVNNGGRSLGFTEEANSRSPDEETPSKRSVKEKAFEIRIALIVCLCMGSLNSNMPGIYELKLLLN